MFILKKVDILVSCEGHILILSKDLLSDTIFFIVCRGRTPAKFCVADGCDLKFEVLI